MKAKLPSGLLLPVVFTVLAAGLLPAPAQEPPQAKGLADVLQPFVESHALAGKGLAIKVGGTFRGRDQKREIRVDS